MTGAPRRILMSADTVGGVWTYALELARALAAYGTEVVLATLGGGATPAQRADAAAVGNIVLVDAPWKCEWMDEPWDDLQRAGEWLLDLAARLPPDVVHLNHYAHGGLAWPAPVMMVGHSDVLSWFRAVRGHEAPAAWNRYRRAVGEGLRAAAMVAAPTATMLRSLVDDYGPLRRTTVIANGCDSARFEHQEDKAELVLAAGRFWDDAKNLTTVDAAAARIEWPVIVAGATDHPDGGERRPRHARSLGRCEADEMAALYARAAIYALPARYEPFGLSVLEAALSGCALVLGDIASLRESWDEAADFVPPEDVDALVGALERLIADPGRRRRRARLAQLRARRFAPERMAAAYLEAYRAIGATVRSDGSGAASGTACA